MRAGVLALALLCACAFHAHAARRIWIDTDPAIGAPWREVDDAFALLLALNSPEVAIVGISTTYGNASLRRTTEVARAFVRRSAKQIGIYPGARSSAELAKRSEATNALAQAVRTQRLTYVALGPLTNLAAFLNAHPALADEIEQLIFVGGRAPEHQLSFGRSGWLRLHDANVVKDPEAVRRVLRSGIPITLAPAQVSGRLVLNRADVARIGQSGDAGAFLRRKSGVWLWFWTTVLRERGGPVFDALAVIACIQPRLIEVEERFAEITAGGDLLVKRGPPRGATRVRCCTSFAPQTQQFLEQRLAKAAPVR
ncbi:MAG TPA: nucleoside hydrolase [Chthoniobacterales bacterium]|nr:nucleoside hydrolase [Chthoniobacterales bacterium]